MADAHASDDLIRGQLEKILASPGFVHNRRLSSFLEYVIGQYLEGHQNHLKESVIGLDVFGRKPGYDPRRDPVVRTEAAKLRARLAEYYAAEGASDRLVIGIPKGGYVPEIHVADRPGVTAVWRHGWTSALVAAVVLLASAGYWLLVQPERSREPVEADSIAVLPFVNLSTDPANEYFSDGLTDELINALSKVQGLRVPARASAFAFKGKREDIRTIGSKLRVGMVLEGSVRKEGEKLRITAQLSKVADGYHLWSQTYDRETKDILAIQDEIARAIVARFKAMLTQPARIDAATTSPEAYTLYLKGRYFQNQGITLLAAQKSAIAHFEQAIAKDRKYALAYTGLADSWYNIGLNDPAQPPDAFPRAEAAAKKALALDDSLSEAHSSLARVMVEKWDWQGAEKELRRAIELNPNNGKARLQYAMSCLALKGRLEEAIEEARRAQDLDLVAPEVSGQFAMLLHCARQYDRAIQMAQQALEMNPKAIGARNMLGRSYTQKGMLEEALSEFEKAETFGRRSHWSASLVGLYVRLGRSAEAEKLLEQWKARSTREFGHAESMAMVNAGLGDKDEAFRWLEKAHQEHWSRLPWIKIAPEYDNLRSDPRFDALLRRMGL